MGWSDFSETQVGLNLLVWMAQVLYVTSFIPQIRENIRLRSERGVSNFFIFGEMNSYMFLAFDIFCNGFPWAYILTVIIQLLGTSILVYQKLKYDVYPSGKLKQQLRFYGLNVAAGLSLIPAAWHYPHFVGELASWCAALLCTVAFVPQAWKIYQSKSIKGFSFYSITLFAMGNMIELYLCFALSLSYAYFFYTIQNIILYSIFCVQFAVYRRPRESLH